MCTKENLTVCLLGLNTLVLASACAIFLIGMVLFLDGDFMTAHGSLVALWGLCMLVSACMLGGVGCMSFCGAQSHNKCLLLTAVGVALLVLTIQVSVSQSMKGFVEPDFDATLVADCLDSNKGVSTSAACTEYFENPATVRLFKLWANMYTTSLDEQSVKATLIEIETSNYCCGFAPAATCEGTTEHTESTDGAYLADDADPLKTAMSRCSDATPGWYQPQSNCKLSISGIVGCPYLFSVSSGCLRDKNIRPGCADAFQQIVIDDITPIADIALYLTGFQIAVAVGSFCLCLKRKSHDVLPPPEAFVDKRFEKYGVMLEPKLDPSDAVEVTVADTAKAP